MNIHEPISLSKVPPLKLDKAGTTGQRFSDFS